MISEYIILKNKTLLLKEINSIEIGSKMNDFEYIEYIFNEYYSLGYLESERSYVVALDYNNNIVEIMLVSSGNYKECYMYKKNIGSFLLLIGACKFGGVHNHPSGNLDISNNDNVATNLIMELSKIIEIDFIFSMIITKYGWIDILTGNGFEVSDDDKFLYD